MITFSAKLHDYFMPPAAGNTDWTWNKFSLMGKKTLAALTDKQNKCEQRLYKTVIYTQKEN